MNYIYAFLLLGFTLNMSAQMDPAQQIAPAAVAVPQGEAFSVQGQLSPEEQARMEAEMQAWQQQMAAQQARYQAQQAAAQAAYANNKELYVGMLGALNKFVVDPQVSTKLQACINDVAPLFKQGMTPAQLAKIVEILGLLLNQMEVDYKIQQVGYRNVSPELRNQADASREHTNQVMMPFSFALQENPQLEKQSGDLVFVIFRALLNGALKALQGTAVPPQSQVK